MTSVRSRRRHSVNFHPNRGVFSADPHILSSSYIVRKSRLRIFGLLLRSAFLALNKRLTSQLLRAPPTILNFLREQHADTLLRHSFGSDVVIIRAYWHARRACQWEPDDVVRFYQFLTSSYGRTSRFPTSSTFVSFPAYDKLELDGADTREVLFALSQGRQTLLPICDVDMSVADPRLVIRQHYQFPYAVSGWRRCERELEKTDMLPLFFMRRDGGVGVPITEEGIDNAIMDSPTRIRATSLKVVTHLVGYPQKNSQIQLPRLQTGILPYIPSAKLAALVAGRVRAYILEIMDTVLPSEGNHTVGTRPGQIGIGDVVLCGVIFVSRGRIMPLLQVQPHSVQGLSTTLL
ncbi:unnamed protein product [Peniophora sp. CBMAI 1063]|nr:unnamed protein product [Peniophora sp. CBMAI 1063]